jgi:Fe-S cluster assembly iron-binding protein IscA
VITVTPQAQQYIQHLLEVAGTPDGGVRISTPNHIDVRTATELDVALAQWPEPGDEIQYAADLRLFLQPEASSSLRGAQLVCEEGSLVLALPEKSEAGTGFRDSIARSLTVWRLHPLLPVLSAVLLVLLPSEAVAVALSTPARALVASSPVSPYALLAVPLAASIPAIGWAGTEQIWYLRAFRGKRIRPEELWSFTWSFFWRYLRLLLLFGLVSGALKVIAPMVLGIHATGWVALFGEALADIVIASAMTFMRPALAYSTSSAVRAVRIGWGMITAEWPAAAPYVIVPPLISAAATLPYAAIPLLPPTATNVLLWRLLVPGVASLLVVLCNGAIASYYLRRYTVDDNGAVHGA